MKKPSRKRASKPSSRKRPPSPPTRPLTFQVTEEPIEDDGGPEIPPEARDALDRLYDWVVSQPREAIRELPGWIAKYPEHPQFSNYLSAAFESIDEKQRAREEYEKCLARHPNYLFGRLGMAACLLGEHQYPEVAKLLDNKFDLTEWYPQRSVFHITEFLAMANVAGQYFVGVGDLDRARLVLAGLRQAAPDSPVTDRLELLLTAKKSFQSLLDIMRKSR